MIKRLIDFHVSTDEVSFVDAWKNGTGVSFHLGKYRVDLCCPHLLSRVSAKAQRQGGHAPHAWRHRDSPRSRH